MLNLKEIQEEIDNRAAVVGAKRDDLPTYGQSRDFGYPHIEVDLSGYHWVVVERGAVLERRTFAELDDLLFTVFEAVTHAIAERWELERRVPTQDSRRLLFQHQLELLSRLDSAWAIRRREHLDVILSKHPFRDGASS
jgi:hypothetical protein